MITQPHDLSSTNQRVFKMLCKRFDVLTLNDLSCEVRARSQTGISIKIVDGGLVMWWKKSESHNTIKIPSDMTFPQFVEDMHAMDLQNLGMMETDESVWNDTHPVGMT